MVGARSAAMTFNRIIDRDIDAENPRTAGRELPTGKLSVGFAWAFLYVSIVVFSRRVLLAQLADIRTFAGGIDLRARVLVREAIYGIRASAAGDRSRDLAFGRVDRRPRAT